MCIYHVYVYYYKPSSIWNYIVLHVYVWVIVCVKEHMRVCVCICVWKLYVCVYVCFGVYVCICICVCVCVYVYICVCVCFGVYSIGDVGRSNQRNKSTMMVPDGVSIFMIRMRILWIISSFHIQQIISSRLV